MTLATDFKVWPNHLAQEKPFFQGWKWFDDTPGVLVIYPPDDQLSINKSQWEAEIKRLSSPHPSIKWNEGDETTLGTIAYVSSEHENVIVRNTRGIKEYPSSALTRKPNKEQFIAGRVASYLGYQINDSAALEKVIVDALIDWEDE